MKLIKGALLATAVVASVSMTMSPASAVAAGVLQGTATVPSFGGSGTDGTFVGTVLVGVDGTQALVNAPATAEFSYTESGATCPATGLADGTLHVNGKDYGFHWQRVGLAALVTFDTGGVAVAVFVPLGLATCAPPVSVSAVVAGAGVLSL